MLGIYLWGVVVWCGLAWWACHDDDHRDLLMTGFLAALLWPAMIPLYLYLVIQGKT